MGCELLFLISHVIGEAMDWTSIITHLSAFITGLGAGWTVRFVYSKRVVDSSRSTKVKQAGNFVAGDMVAGDMHKNNKT